MRLQFLGANRQVTGSRYKLASEDGEFLIDCGQFQEREFQNRNWDDPPFRPNQLDAVLLTHAHLDHCGLLPRLVAQGFKGPIFATSPTIRLAQIVLEDAAEIQVEEAAYKRRRHEKEHRKGKHPELPLFTGLEVRQTIPLFRSVSYRRPLSLPGDLTVSFCDAGHILGSAMLEIQCPSNGTPRRIIFSGDIGQWNKPLIRDPSTFAEADYVVMESTYGDRKHNGGAVGIEDQLADVILRTIGRGGNVVIPTFAVERAQELMYFISRLVHSDRIPDLSIFLDSPMAVDVTRVFQESRAFFDAGAWNLINSNEPPLRFPGLHLVRSVDESKAIKSCKDPCIIMASSGMCTAGRVKHHLRANLSRPESTVLFVGYQGKGTLGRQILDGNTSVRIHGRDHEVKAEVSQIQGCSGHADQTALLSWLSHLQRPPREIFLTHGDPEAAEELAGLIRSRWDWNVSVPDYLDCVELS